mgnify:CR=1 FL=1
MKPLIVFALLVAIATATSFGGSEFHLHLNTKNPAANLVVRGLVSRYIEEMSLQGNQHNIGVHLHLDDLTGEEIENFDILDDILGGIKKGFDVTVDGIKKGVNVTVDGIVKGVNVTVDGIVKGANVTVDGIAKGVNVTVDGIKKGFNATVDGLKTGVDHVHKGFSIVEEGIIVAIKQTEKAFKIVKNEIENLKLPFINIPKLIQPIINIGKLATRIIPCGVALKNAIPPLFNFAKAAVTGNAAKSVESLMALLEYMPDISEKCTGSPFTIPPNFMNKAQCIADIVALATMVGQLILAPENVIATYHNIKGLVDLIPNTIADCTGAFQ